MWLRIGGHGQLAILLSVYAPIFTINTVFFMLFYNVFCSIGVAKNKESGAKPMSSSHEIDIFGAMVSARRDGAAPIPTAASRRLIPAPRGRDLTK